MNATRIGTSTQSCSAETFLSNLIFSLKITSIHIAMIPLFCVIFAPQSALECMSCHCGFKMVEHYNRTVVLVMENGLQKQ